MKITHSIILTLLLFSNASCAYKDLSGSLRSSYADEKLGIENVKFQDLRDMKTGKSCSYSALYVFPIGNSSVIQAAKNGEINKVLFIGESGFWGFPFSKTCIVVFGN